MRKPQPIHVKMVFQILCRKEVSNESEIKKHIASQSAGEIEGFWVIEWIVGDQVHILMKLVHSHCHLDATPSFFGNSQLFESLAC